MSWTIPVFGVRHLSPGGAWHVVRFLDQLRPYVVLIEGIADANDLIPDLTHSVTRLPVAILAYTDAVPVRTIVTPFASYSPEYQAMRWAIENNARVEFIDLPSDIVLGLQEADIQRQLSRIRADNPANGSPQPLGGRQPQSDPDDEGTHDPAAWRPEPRRSIYDRVAQAMGESSYDDYWERHFEQNLHDEAYRLAALELGKALRDEPDPTPWRAENLVREAYMRRRIEETLADQVPPDKIVAVVGAFHAPVLTGDHPAMTDDELKSLPRRSSKLTLMPYSYFRLSSQSGYGAGNRAPAYFEMLWDLLNSGGLDHLPDRYLTEVVRHLRQSGTHRSTAEVIEGVRLARTLAALKGGSAPILADLRDAAVTIMGHGEASSVAEALMKVDVGTAIGYLPKGVGRTSIQEDFERLLTRLKLDKYKTTVAQVLELDLRENRQVKSAESAYLDLNRSTFLHRLRVLGVGFAEPVRSTQRDATWKEVWKVQWSPESEISLVEAVLMGETVELATASKIKSQLEECQEIAQAADLVNDACLCGLHGSLDHARSRLQELAAVSSDFGSIARAAAELSQVIRYGDVRKFDATSLLPLMEALFVQGALALPSSANCDQQAAQTLMPAIDALNRVALDHHDRVEVELWLSQLQGLSNADDRNPTLSGYACAVLLERGLIPNDQLTREVSRRLSPGVPADLGAGWFEGLAQRNRAALLARQALWAELADYVNTLDPDQFKRALVFLRRAFGSFSPHQKRMICENLGELWGLNPDLAAETLETPLTEAEQQALTELNELDFDDL